MAIKNKSQRKEYAAEYYLKNRERINTKNRQYALDNPEKTQERHRRWYTENKVRSAVRMRDNHLRKKYGITQVEYETMLVRQHGGCAICQKKPKRLAVDHCHRLGRIRGLLCRECNVAIGLFNENPHIMIEAIAYVTGVKDK